MPRISAAQSVAVIRVAARLAERAAERAGSDAGAPAGGVPEAGMPEAGGGGVDIRLVWKRGAAAPCSRRMNVCRPLPLVSTFGLRPAGVE